MKFSKSATEPLPPLRQKLVRGKFSSLGLILAAPTYILALTPSLLARSLMFLILLGGLGIALGYVLGATAGWIAKKLSSGKTQRIPMWIKVISLVVVWVLAFAFTYVAETWQQQQQVELRMPSVLPSQFVLFVASIVVGVLLIVLGRSLRLFTRTISRWFIAIPVLWRWVHQVGPLREYRRTMWVRVITAFAIILAINLVLGFGFNAFLKSYDTVNADTSGQSATHLGNNSGSADSLTPWNTLGREGRYFVSNTLTSTQIESVSLQPASTPLRLYVGMQQGETPQERSALAIKELDRSGAWDKEYLAIVSLTGTGWVDPDAINSLETVTNGNIASIGVQYSAVPSWIGFVIDPLTTQEQNADSIHAIVAAWKERPVNKRPKLILFGESLGAFGSQAAWNSNTSPQQVVEDFNSVIWVGPPAESALWKAWQANRSAGPAWQPTIGDGSIARVFISSQELMQAQPLPGKAITYSAHPNDPVVYWSPDLMFNRPDWIDPPLGPGVDPHLTYSWIITCLQVGMDLISGGAPPEVGHNYSADIGPAVALTINPQGWNKAKTVSLQAALPKWRYVTG